MERLEMVAAASICEAKKLSIFTPLDLSSRLIWKNFKLGSEQHGQTQALVTVEKEVEEDGAAEPEMVEWGAGMQVTWETALQPLQLTKFSGGLFSLS